MRHLLIAILSVAILASCNTDRTLTRDQRIAQRKLSKALKHDPNIISRQYTDTIIRGYADGIALLKLKAQELESSAFACDSVNRLLTTLQAALYAKGDSSKAELFLYRDSLASISVRKEPGNKLSIKYQIRDREVKVPVSVPYEVRVKVPGKVVKQYQPYPCYHYWWFYGLILLCIVFVYLYFRTLPIRVVMSRMLTKQP